MYLFFLFLIFYINIFQYISYIYWKEKKEPIYSLCQDRTSWRLYFWGLAIRKAVKPLGEHLLLEIIDSLCQGTETVIAIRAFGWDWNILLQCQGLKMITGKGLGCAVGATWSHRRLRVGSSSFWVSNTLLNRTVKCNEKCSACLDLALILSYTHVVYLCFWDL